MSSRARGSATIPYGDRGSSPHAARSLRVTRQRAAGRDSRQWSRAQRPVGGSGGPPPPDAAGRVLGKQFADRKTHTDVDNAAWEAPVALASRFYPAIGLVYRTMSIGAAPPSPLRSQLSRVCSAARSRQSPPPVFHSTPGVGPSRLAGEAIRHEPKTRHPSPFLRTPSAPPAAATQPYAPISLQSARQNRQNRQNRPCAS